VTLIRAWLQSGLDGASGYQRCGWRLLGSARGQRWGAYRRVGEDTGVGLELGLARHLHRPGTMTVPSAGIPFRDDRTGWRARPHQCSYADSGRGHGAGEASANRQERSTNFKAEDAGRPLISEPCYAAAVVCSAAVLFQEGLGHEPSARRAVCRRRHRAKAVSISLTC
jgi:hypothetical protein